MAMRNEEQRKAREARLEQMKLGRRADTDQDSASDRNYDGKSSKKSGMRADSAMSPNDRTERDGDSVGRSRTHSERGASVGKDHDDESSEEEGEDHTSEDEDEIGKMDQ